MFRSHRWRVTMALWLAIAAVACSAGESPTEEDPSTAPESETAIVGRVVPAESGIGIIAVRNGFDTATTLTDETGAYRLDDLRPGEYSLIASGLGFFTDTSVRNLILQEGEQIEAPLITMRPLAAAATIRGQVVDAQTLAPIEGVKITVRCRSGICSNLAVTTDEAGQYETDIWPDLDADLSYQAEGYRVAEQSVKGQPPGTTLVLPLIQLEPLTP